MLALGAALLTPGGARACGVSSPDGASLCALAAGQGPKWRASLSGIYTATRLRFSGGMRGDETRAGVVGALSYQLSPRLAIQAGLGPSFGGAFEAPDGRHPFQPGVLGLVGASYRVHGGPAYDENGEGVNQDPFVLLTSALAFNVTHTTHESGADPPEGRTLYHAYDLRLGVVVGFTIADRLRPYALGRVFGGPIFWRYHGAAVTGTDLYHVQLGAGFSLALGKGFAVYAEGVPLGERGLSAGVAQAF